MRHCSSEVVDMYESSGPNLGQLLIEAAGLVDKHGGVSQVNTAPGVDPDTNRFTYNVTVFLYG